MQRRQHSWRATPVTEPAALPRQPPMIIKQPGVTAHAQIEDWLADAIAAGQLAPGDRLPTEHDLAAWLAVGRRPHRRALGGLAQRGPGTRPRGPGRGELPAQPEPAP